MQGGATGAGSVREGVGCHQAWDQAVRPAKLKWGAHGRAGGPMRNQRMIEWKPDGCHGIPRRSRDGGYGAARRQCWDHRSGWRQIRDRLRLDAEWYYSNRWPSGSAVFLGRAGAR